MRCGWIFRSSLRLTPFRSALLSSIGLVLLAGLLILGGCARRLTSQALLHRDLDAPLLRLVEAGQTIEAGLRDSDKDAPRHARVTGIVLSHRSVGTDSERVQELSVRVESDSAGPSGESNAWRTPDDIRLWYALPEGERLPVGAGDPIALELSWPNAQALERGGGSAVLYDTQGEPVFLWAVQSAQRAETTTPGFPFRLQPTSRAAFWRAQRFDGGVCDAVVEQRVVRVDLLVTSGAPEKVGELAPGESVIVNNLGARWEIQLLNASHTLKSTCAVPPPNLLAYVARRLAGDEGGDE